MRRLALLFLLAFLWACNKKNKEPDCRFTAINYPGNTTKLPVTYQAGDTVVTVGENDHGYNLYFNEQKRLLRREEPVQDPYYRYEVGYSSNGQATDLKFYIRQSGSWVYEGRLVFTYNAGRIVNIREENSASQAGNSYDHQITWQGDNIQSVEHRLNQVPTCTTQFSYDAATPNPMRRFSYLYFVDGDANYVYYKLPYYFSGQLVTKQESTCPLSETRSFSYTYTSTGLVETMSDQTGATTRTIWEYEYECR